MNFPCPACQASVSETALACPSCGKSFMVTASAAPPPAFSLPGSPYAPPGAAAGPFGARSGYSHEASRIGREALGYAIGAMFCFAPLAFYALKLAGRAEELASLSSTQVPPNARTARTVSYVALMLWFLGIAFRIAMNARR